MATRWHDGVVLSTTFGYHAGEDRVWLACPAWPQRLWLTRRIVRQILGAVVQQIEAGPAAEGDAAPLAAAQRAAAEHEASLNQRQPGEPARALQTGREAVDARALADAVLCTRFALLRGASHIDLVFVTTAGERRLHLSRIGLHRWVHGLHMVLSHAQWQDWAPSPDWLTRSYLPPALQRLLQGHAPQAGPGADNPRAPQRGPDA